MMEVIGVLIFCPKHNTTTNTTDGQPLTISQYTEAQHHPFKPPAKPGISVSGDGRGDNMPSGWFDILDIACDASGQVLRFAVDFKQLDEGVAKYHLTG